MQMLTYQPATLTQLTQQHAQQAPPSHMQMLTH